MAWKIDDYFDITKEQKKVLKNEILKVQQDFIAPELKELAPQIEKFKANKNEENLEILVQTVMVLTQKLIIQIEDPTINFIASLSDSQINFFEKQLNHENEAIEDKLKDTEDVILKRNLEEYCDRFEFWVGYLNKSQKEQIKKWLIQSPPPLKERFAERKKSQKEMILIFRTHNREKISNYIKSIKDRYRGSDNPGFKKNWQEFQKVWMDYVGQFLKTLEEDQSKKLNKEIDRILEFISDKLR